MRTKIEKILCFPLLTALIFAGCSSSEKEDMAGPIVLDETPSKINETEQMVTGDEVTASMRVEEGEEGQEVEEVRVFKKGDWKRYQHPLPSYQPIYSIWTKGGQELQRSLAYHGWDLNLDGQLDMFEGLDLDGEIYIKLFDFNFDGKIDHVEKKMVAKAPVELETLEVQ
ncbi:hypothetical protein N9W79_00755 [bacterium]|nr:hypothetical protein [bacterium]